jgi:hypothetical protein
LRLFEFFEYLESDIKIRFKKIKIKNYLFEVIVNTVKMINRELKPSYAEGDSDAYKQVSPEIMSTT